MKMNKKQRFSIRKYSFGIASVLVGSVLLGAGVASANTDTPPNSVAPLAGYKDQIINIYVDGAKVDTKATTFATDTELLANVDAARDEYSTDYDFASDNNTVWDGDNVSLYFVSRPVVRKDQIINIYVDGAKVDTKATTFATDTELLANVDAARDEYLTDYDFASDNNTVWDGDNVSLYFVSRPVVDVTSKHSFEIYVDGKLAGNVSTTEYTAEGFATAVENIRADYAGFDYVGQTGAVDADGVQVNKIYYATRPVVEETSKHSFEIYVDGKLAGAISATEYTAEAFATTVENIRADYAGFDYVDQTAAVDADGVQVNKFYYVTKPVVEDNTDKKPEGDKEVKETDKKPEGDKKNENKNSDSKPNGGAGAGSTSAPTSGTVAPVASSSNSAVTTEKKLPETGAKDTAALASVGLVLLLSSLGLATTKRRF